MMTRPMGIYSINKYCLFLCRQDKQFTRLSHSKIHLSNFEPSDRLLVSKTMEEGGNGMGSYLTADKLTLFWADFSFMILKNP